jgi:3-oxoadipate CoA-transferase beta subunit
MSRVADLFNPDDYGDIARRATRELAVRVAEDIHDGWFVNLGIGKPTIIADVVDVDREIIFHSENGIVGMGRYAEGDEIDTELINAGKEHVTLVTGAAIVHHSDSFALVRGGHIDLTVMGAFQVAQNGDYANWTIPGEKVPAVGGAMDLAVGARRVWVMMDLFDRSGASKLCDRCWYPLTARGAVQRVYTDLAVFDITPGGFAVREIVDGLSFEELQRHMPVDLSSDPAV